MARKKDIILCIDVKGAMEIKKKFPKESVFIFVVPPNEKVLIQRTHTRAREDKKEIERRLAFAKTELAFAKEYDYIIVNDDLSKALRDLEAIIIAKGLENVLYTARKNH